MLVALATANTKKFVSSLAVTIDSFTSHGDQIKHIVTWGFFLEVTRPRLNHSRVPTGMAFQYWSPTKTSLFWFSAVHHLQKNGIVRHFPAFDKKSDGLYDHNCFIAASHRSSYTTQMSSSTPSSQSMRGERPISLGAKAGRG
jgi:hypothetical protein